MPDFLAAVEGDIRGEAALPLKRKRRSASGERVEPKSHVGQNDT